MGEILTRLRYAFMTVSTVQILILLYAACVGVLWLVLLSFAMIGWTWFTYRAGKRRIEAIFRGDV